jgi:hypothetical protein
LTLARSLIAVAVVASGLVSSAFACSSGGGAAADAGTDGKTDATRSDVARESGSDEALTDGGAPFLTSLRVTGSGTTDAAAAVGLAPAFSPTIHDYYVRCVAGKNALKVSMTASTGAESLLTQPIKSSPKPAQTLSVSVEQNAAIVAVAMAGTATAEYWVRCLPDDFPLLEWTLYPEAGLPPPGYYLVGNQATIADAGWAMVLDVNGVPVWYQRAPTSVYDVDDVVDGAISFALYPEKNGPFEIRYLDPPSTVDLGSNVNPHELRRLSSGNSLVINSTDEQADLTGVEIPLSDGGVASPGPNSTIRGCNVDELDPSGNVVWSWQATQYLDPVMDCTYPEIVQGDTNPDGGAIIDVFHCNSIDIDPNNGNLLISARNMDTVFYVDRTTKDILWKMGGSSFTKDGATYVSLDAADAFYRQHDARLQPGWSPTCRGGTGEISLYDDETSRPGSSARAVVYSVVVGDADGGGACDGGSAEGGTPGVAKSVWQYVGASGAAFSGSFRITPDGSRVIGWGSYGKSSLVMTEVNIDGKDLLDLRSSDGMVSYRAIKAPLSAFSIGVLRDTAGLP